jgi:hypothetical protein
MDWSILEGVKLIGSLLGIATASFIVYDRFIRSRLIVALHVKKPELRSENEVYLRIRNTVPEDIVVDAITIQPPFLTLAYDDDVQSMTNALIGSFNRIVVGPHDERLLLIVIRDRKDVSKSAPVAISVAWRATRRPGHGHGSTKYKRRSPRSRL